MFKDYQQFVLSKAAPPRPINERDFQLLHAALGLSTEFLEYDIAHNREDILEEVGDLVWYMMLTAHAVEFPVTNLPDSVEPRNHPLLDLSTDIERFVSLIKKHCIYGADKTKELPLVFYSMWRSFVAFCQDEEIELDVLIAENQDKLNKRYAAAFTTQESEDRKDKQ